MNRAPHAAWRTLLAAGGAPAASHAALGLVALGDAVGEALLAPLAKLPLLHDGRFDALVRPIELSSVLGRRVGGNGASPAAAQVTIDASESDVEHGRRASARAEAHREEARRRKAQPGLAPRASERDDTVRRRPAPTAPHHSSHPPVPPRFDASDAISNAETRAGVAAATRTNEGTHRRRGEAIVGDGRESLYPPKRSAVHESVLAPLATHRAARTPVVIGVSPTSVRRLLEAVSADAAIPPDARSRDTAAAERPTPRRPYDGSALERALARISDRGNTRATGGDAGRDVGRHAGRDADTASETRRSGRPIDVGTGRGASTALEQRAAAKANDPMRVTDEPVHHENGSGGFRGLATRAIRQTDGAIPAVSGAEPRLTREVRTISDLPLDTLDASVAESVTRILQREARRHGIDLAETGT